MFDFNVLRCCSDKSRAAARDMLQVCKTHNLTVGEAADAIKHLNAHISRLTIQSPISVLQVHKEIDIK